MQSPLVVANWKMNGNLKFIDQFFSSLDTDTLNVEVVICPPAPYLSEVSERVRHSSNLSVGAQNMHFAENGAFTGEISASMLEDFSCSYVIIGHSERRSLFSEDNELIAKKVSAVASSSMVTPILCVGETLEQRESNSTLDVIKEQLQVLDNLNKKNVVVAYEPIWAIGTGKTATSNQAQEVHAFIREWIMGKFGGEVAESTRILYGGSVKPSNAKELFSQKDIDGALVGGASLKAQDFAKIYTSF